ncbi:MAG: hypothetical protein ACPGUC_11010 [Gammaproteobacteria bacterium]
MEIENGSGRSLLSVEQGFYAKILATNLCSLVRFAAQVQVKHTHRRRQRRYPVNFSRALSTMKHRVVVMIRSTANVLTELIQAAVDQVALHPEAIRPDRSFPRRVIKLHTNTHHPAYKRSL